MGLLCTSLRNSRTKTWQWTRAVFGGRGGEEESLIELEDKSFTRTAISQFVLVRALRSVATVVIAMISLKRIRERDIRKSKMAINKHELILDLISK